MSVAQNDFRCKIYPKEEPCLIVLLRLRVIWRGVTEITALLHIPAASINGKVVTEKENSHAHASTRRTGSSLLAQRFTCIPTGRILLKTHYKKQEANMLSVLTLYATDEVKAQPLQATLLQVVVYFDAGVIFNRFRLPQWANLQL